jgi:hypothetical protein
LGSFGFFKIGYKKEGEKETTKFKYWDQETTNLNKKIDGMKLTHGENFAELTRCVIYHEKILE